MDNVVTPRVDAETGRVRQELATLMPARDQAMDEAARLQDRIDQARAEQAGVQKQIDAAKNSEICLYSRIVKLHAAGRLAEAREQFAALLARFPGGPLGGLIRGQLTQVTSEMAVRNAEEKQAEAVRIRLEAHARADLLARARAGRVTLSEMRRTLIGKSRAEVGALLGPPTETASDRWGYGREMIVDPLSGRKNGLAVHFFEGTVQGVDYYYGREGHP